MKIIQRQFRIVFLVLYLISINGIINGQAYDPCISITAINCGVQVTSVIDPGSGAYDATNCYSFQYGQEKIYQFTSGDAGAYTISTTGWGAVQFAFKLASNGCNPTGWNCIDPIYGQGTYLLGMLSANTTYYLLHDVSSTYGESTTFQVDCYTPNFPCLNITNIAGCGVPVNAFIPAGFGGYSGTQCQYYQNEGKERIYSFTPVASGTYTMTLNNNGYYTAGFSYKKAALGCDELNWNCIMQTSYNNTYLIGYLMQGVTYYILQDAFSISGADFTLQIDCYVPSAPCASTINLTCGVINNFTIQPGAGIYNEGSCYVANDPTAGKEIIYQFTPTTTGNSIINITSVSYSYPVRYYFKEASVGCNATNWTCLGESNVTTLLIPGTLVSGTTYLLMVDGVNFNGGSQSFEITCPATWNPCASVVPITSGTTISANISYGLGAYNDDPVFSQTSCMGSGAIGRELIYSFVPSTSGTYALNVINTDYINGISYLIKEAGSGCNILDWTCIGGTAYPTYYPLYISFPMVAGQTYLIMLKAFNYAGAAHDFSLTSPDLYEPCLSIPLVNCGDVTNVNIPSGLGAFPSNSDGFIFAGKEKIFEFTPTVSGNHLFNTNSLSFNQSVQYFVKVASDGCNNDNWNSLANVYFGMQTFAFPFSLNAGTAYYIMADGSDPSQTADQEFTIICPETATEPCASVTSIPGCGIVMNSIRAAGLGNYGSINSCYNFQEPGKENIYEFIAPATGNYTLSFVAGGTGTELFFVKETLLGCTNNIWQCITGAIAMQAGTSYYIMVDGTDTLGSSLTFQINCPHPDPCLNIQAIECGWQNPVDVIIPAGAGKYTIENCNSYLLPHGREAIYAFTPLQDGTYFLNASNISSQKVFFFIKNASTGCGFTGWDCITSSYTNYMYNEPLPYDLLTGNTYYIMVDDANVYGTSLTFDLTCATGCSQFADYDGDGYGDPDNASYSCFPVLGFVPDNSDCNDLSATVNIGAVEDCNNNIDDNCNGQINENCSSPCNLTVNAGADESTFYGYSYDQALTRSASVSGGTAPFTWSWTMDRPLKCNQVNSAGDEIFTQGTCVYNSCPASGSPTFNPFCSGSAIVMVKLMDTTSVCVTVTDANGCIATDCFTVMAVDARCFAGNSNNTKVKVCHFSNNTNNPWVQLCVSEDAVANLVAQGDYVGNCVQSRFAFNENSIKGFLNVFPNPASGILNVSYNTPDDEKICIQLSDVTGRIVFTNVADIKSGDNSIKLELGTIATGLYNLSFSTDDGMQNVSVVLQ